MDAHDRCDSCTAAAQVRVRRRPKVATDTGRLLFPEELEAATFLFLDFCNHHFQAFSDALELDGWRVVARRKEPEPV